MSCGSSGNGEHVWLPSHFVAVRARCRRGHFLIRSLCFVKRGTVFHSRRLLIRGQCFGDDMLLNALDGSWRIDIL